MTNGQDVSDGEWRVTDNDYKLIQGEKKGRDMDVIRHMLEHHLNGLGKNLERVSKPLNTPC